MDDETVVRRRNEQGFTRNEFLVAMSVALFIAALATPGLVRRQRAAKSEIAVRALLSALKQAQSTYAASCGNGAYATSFDALRGHNRALVDVVVAGPSTIGYEHFLFRLVPGRDADPGPLDCHGRPTYTSYVVSAHPISPGAIARRAFSLDATGAIREHAAVGAIQGTSQRELDR